MKMAKTPAKAKILAKAKTPAKKNAAKEASAVTGAESGAKKTPKRKSLSMPEIGAAAGHVDAAVLDRLYDVVLSRREADPSSSHSARLLSRGTGKVAQKFGEEAVECLIEAVAGRKQELVGESADVLYHLIVLWVNAGVTPDEVWSELQRREGTSGIAEKASRPRGDASQ
jgi:phosphoribosyl-ATP pyrophosphohydrolase